MTDTAGKGFGCTDEDTARYAVQLLSQTEGVLAGIRERSQAAGLPDIHVSAADGRHLEVIARAIGARRTVEVGTLAGYSGVCLLRGMGPGGVLHTLELDPRHASVAAETFRLAGFESQAHVHVGKAADSLARLSSEGPFDLMFIDADKTGYPDYLAWAADNLRVGGTVLADNVFLWGALSTTSKLKDASVDAMRRFNATAVQSPRFTGTLLPTGEGLAMAVKIR